jgi:N-acetylmuramoyl-L-alanine amidase
MKNLVVLLLPLVVLLPTACSVTSTGNQSWGGSTRDALGHRQGPQNFRTVIIDAGHGGKDSGAVSRINRAKEKDLALDVAMRLKNQLSGQFNVVMMRSGDNFVELDDRVAKANRYGDGILVSIHFNQGPSSVAGPETYYWRVDSHGLATRVQSGLRAVSPSNSSRGLVRRRVRLTRNPEIPSILVECGYLSNRAEAQRCVNPQYRQRLAEAVAGAIRNQAAMGDSGTGPLPRPINSPLSRPTDAPE